MNRLAWVMLAGIMVGGCSDGIGSMVGIGGKELDPGDKVRDESAAIEIGQRMCSQGAQSAGAYNWHAKLEGNNWRVWSGPEYDGHHVMELKVAKSTGKATECFRYAG